MNSFTANIDDTPASSSSSSRSPSPILGFSHRDMVVVHISPALPQQPPSPTPQLDAMDMDLYMDDEPVSCPCSEASASPYCFRASKTATITSHATWAYIPKTPPYKRSMVTVTITPAAPRHSNGNQQNRIPAASLRNQEARFKPYRRPAGSNLEKLRIVRQRSPMAVDHVTLSATMLATTSDVDVDAPLIRTRARAASV